MSLISKREEDYEINTKVSKIKPSDEEIRKKVKSAKIKPKDEIEFNDRSYQSYLDNGFPIDPTDTNNMKAYKICYIRQQKLDFISRIDLSKGKFRRDIFLMKRLKAPDYDEDGEPTKPKEWIMYQEYWRAKNWLGKKLFVTNVEGVYDEATRELNTDFDPETGDVKAEYIQGRSRTRYHIPFSKKAVDEILAKVGTDKNEIQWYAEIPNSAKGVGFRSGNYTYDQFVNTTWDEFEDLARREGEPTVHYRQ